MGGWGLGEMLRRIWVELRQPLRNPATVHFERRLMVGAALLAGWFSLDLDQARRQVLRIEGNPRVQENPVVLTLKAAAPEIRHACARHPAFLA